jgi:hypothetical protein
MLLYFVASSKTFGRFCEFAHPNSFWKQEVVLWER